MEENKLKPILTTEVKIPNSNASIILGTVDKHNCSCFYIQMGMWITIPDFQRKNYVKMADRDGFEDNSSGWVVKNFESKAKFFIRKLIHDIHPQHKHHMISVNITEAINNITNSGYCSFEVTVMLHDDIELTNNNYLHSQVGVFGELVMVEVLQIEPSFVITKKKPGAKQRGVPKGYKFSKDVTKYKPKKLKPYESHL